jgi:type I restriction enzyme M protein
LTDSNGHVPLIWGIAELLRGDYKASEYGKVVLPFTVLRRLDLVLAETKTQVLEEAARAEGRDFDPEALLRKASGNGLFYNVSPLDLEKIAADPSNVASGLREYLAGFSPVVREIFEAFRFDEQITRLHKARLLYRVLGKFIEPSLRLHPDEVSDVQMGDMFEELIRRFSEVSNETAGEHFTPREVVKLCASLVLAGDEAISQPRPEIRKVYDPACGTGGMLSVTDELVRGLNPKAHLFLYGQELNPESWAICRSEMLLKGQDPSRIYPHSSLSRDGLDGERFDYLLANPPFGVDWSKDDKEVIEERDKLGFEGRFGAGTPAKNDGTLLFLQTMLAKMSPAEDGGGRIAIVFNGSPLFGGGAGSGPSNIRRWILENDWLETIVALPDQLFYNTGIATYVWILTNAKAPERRRQVQLLDARDMWDPMPKTLGSKRRRLSPEHIKEIGRLRNEFAAGDRCQIHDSESFFFRQVTVERPLRLRYEVGEDSLADLRESKAFEKLALPAANSKEPKAAVLQGEEAQRGLLAALGRLDGAGADERSEAEAWVDEALSVVERPTPALRQALLGAVSVRDPSAAVVVDAKGRPQPDPELRDTENVPFDADVDAYLETEVLPFVPDAWLDRTKDKIGTEIPLSRLFYRYRPPRPLEQVDDEIRGIEERVRGLTWETLS